MAFWPSNVPTLSIYPLHKLHSRWLLVHRAALSLGFLGKSGLKWLISAKNSAPVTNCVGSMRKRRSGPPTCWGLTYTSLHWPWLMVHLAVLSLGWAHAGSRGRFLPNTRCGGCPKTAIWPPNPPQAPLALIRGAHTRAFQAYVASQEKSRQKLVVAGGWSKTVTLRSGSFYASTQKVCRPRSQSPLHFDVGNM